jgi:hypothetical protein
MTPPETRHDPPAGVYVPASLAYPLWLALRSEAHRARAGGHQLRPEVMSALDALRAAAMEHMSASGRGNRTLPHDRVSDRLVSTGELAERLGVSGRHVLRLAAAAGITRVAWGLWAPEDADRLVRIHRKAA